MITYIKIEYALLCTPAAGGVNVSLAFKHLMDDLWSQQIISKYQDLNEKSQ